MFLQFAFRNITREGTIILLFEIVLASRNENNQLILLISCNNGKRDLFLLAVGQKTNVFFSTKSFVKFVVVSCIYYRKYIFHGVDLTLQNDNIQFFFQLFL